MRMLRVVAPAAMALALCGCSISGLLGGGGKAPATLLTLTPEAQATGEFTRAAAAGQAVTVNPPVIGKELRTVRIPVQITPTDVQYVTNAQWVDTPDRLFANLLSETIRRRTNRVVLDPNLTGLDPGLIVAGQLQSFGLRGWKRAGSKQPLHRTERRQASVRRSIARPMKSPTKSPTGSETGRHRSPSYDRLLLACS